MSVDPLKVAMGVIMNDQSQVLIARRGAHQHLAGYWEFPGGKIEMGETPEDALQRELLEEVGIHIVAPQAMMTFQHTSDKGPIEFHVFRVTAFTGQAQGCEGQAIQWIPLANLPEYRFPPANIHVLKSITI